MQLIDGLYHFQVGLPQDVVAKLTGEWSLHYSAHARKEADNDRYGKIKLPDKVPVFPGSIVEIEIRGGVPVKFVSRWTYPYPGRVETYSKHDLVLAIGVDNWPAPRGKEPATVRTVWLNERKDRHVTLDRSKYRKLPKGYNITENN